VGIDVSAQVIARRKIEQSEAELNEEVRKRTHELNMLNESLQQSNNDLQQFAHVASHDLKEPLRKIKVFSGRLADDPGTVFSPKARMYIEKVNSAVNRMFMMVEGVLNYSMMNAASQTIEPVDLESVFRNIESDLELVIAQKSASLSYAQLPTVEGAAVLIYQLFYNLINNSLKFSKDDEKPRISVSSSIINRNGMQFAQITVEDNGIGFEQEQAQRIFNTFERLNSKDRYEGTGLGLSLCKRIVQRHGGSIEAYGKEDQGAVFVVELPVKQERGTI
jgi:light-regulated signal transduction histidine kinase (bacteriophytochrome)